MSRRSDYGRLGIAYDMDRYGLVHTPTEAERFRKAKKRKENEKAARKKNRRKGGR